MGARSQKDHKMCKEIFYKNCHTQAVDGELRSIATKYCDAVNPFDKDEESVRYDRFKRWWNKMYQDHLWFEDILDVMGGRPLVIDEKD
jgi:hypothetical protein